MTTTTRRFLYTFFILLFFIAAAGVLFVAGGYRYDWHRRTLYQPGMIVLEVEPQPTTISVDGEPTDSAGKPLRVGPLASGVHTVRLERDGYRSWQARLTVNDGQATTVPDIRLFREVPPLEYATQVDRFVPAPGGGRVALVGTSGTISLLDLTTRDTTVILPRLTGTLDDLMWMNGGDTLLLRSTSDGVQTLTLLNRTGTVRPLDVPMFAGDRVTPSASRNDRLWLLREGTLSELTITTPVTQTVVDRDVQAWIEDGDRIVMLRSDGTLVELPANDSAASAKTIASLGPMRQPRFLAVMPRDTLTIIDDNARQLQLVRRNEDPVTSLAIENIGEAEWNDSHTTLLLANQYELFLLERDDDDPVLLRRSGDPFSHPHWLQGGKAFLAMQNNALVAFDARGLTDPFLVASGNILDYSVMTEPKMIVALVDGTLIGIEL